MSKIKYKLNGYWFEIEVQGIIEAVGFQNDEEIDDHIYPEEFRNDPQI